MPVSGLAKTTQSFGDSLELKALPSDFVVIPGGKSREALCTIGEVSESLDIQPHILRFWQEKFSSIQPIIGLGGRRYYRPEDVDLLKKIRDLLYNQGYTIKGVQQLLKMDKPVQSENEVLYKHQASQEDAFFSQTLEDLLNELSAIKSYLLG